jgi:hypothetical protein
MARSNHIFPLFLDGAVQTAAGIGGTGATSSWNGTSSFVKTVTGSNAPDLTFTVPNATIPGTTIVITHTGTTAVSVTPTTTIYNDTTIDVVTLNAVGESVTMFWNGSGWAFIGSTETIAIA